MRHRKSILFVLFIAFTLTALGQQATQDHKILFEKAKFTMETKGDLNAAIGLFNDLIRKYPKEREYAAKSQLYIGLCYEKFGTKEAQKAYESVVREYSDQSDIVVQAKARLASLTGSGNETEGIFTRRLLNDASAVSGVLTTDGKSFLSIDRKTGDIILYDIASSKTSRFVNKGVPSEPGDVFELPVSSRNGKQIAYCAYTKGNDWSPKLRIRNFDGTELRTLYDKKGIENIMPVDWLPGGEAILAFCNHRPSMELIRVSTKDSSVQILKSITSPMFMFQKAGFSPDGKYIAYSCIQKGNPSHGDLFLMTADGKNEIVVAGHPAEDQLLGWTPSGKHILFFSDRSGTWDIWGVKITEGMQQGEPELLKKEFGRDTYILGLSAGGTLYYTNYTALGGFYDGEIDIDNGKLVVPPHPVTTRYSSPPSMPVYSPNGKNMAYISRRGSICPGNNILTIRSTGTGEERFLSPQLRYINQISWAPDSRSIIALGISETETGVFRVDIETSETTRIANIGLLPNICPDGKTLVFVDDGPIIKKRNLETGEVSEIVKAGPWHYDLSPDGREVVFQLDSAVKIVSINGGDIRELMHGIAKNYWLKWTKDGRYIIAQTLFTESGEIWRIPAHGGTPLKLDLSIPKIKDNCGCLTLHPDNRHFAFSVNNENKIELWALENFLPKR